MTEDDLWGTDTDFPSRVMAMSMYADHARELAEFKAELGPTHSSLLYLQGILDTLRFFICKGPCQQWTDFEKSIGVEAAEVSSTKMADNLLTIIEANENRSNPFKVTSVGELSSVLEELFGTPLKDTDYN